MAGASMGDIGGIGERQLTFDANRTEKSEMVTIEIDLTDPQDLMKKMEMLDLTELETDMLIDRAMELNQKLRQLEKEDILEKEFRCFTVSAPASKPNVRAGHRGIFTPSSPRSNYRHNAITQDRKLARLGSGNQSSILSPSSRGSRLEPLCNPYSYHSARPIQVMGKQGANKEGTSRYTSSMNDY